MKLEEYQKQAMTTCMATCENIPYMLFNLQGEVGELSSKIAKLIRKGNLVFLSRKDANGTSVDNTHIYTHLDNGIDINAVEEEIKKEAGDVLWQLSGLCSVLGFSLEDVAKMNLDKLASRKQRGVIDGNGDNR